MATVLLEAHGSVCDLPSPGAELAMAVVLGPHLLRYGVRRVGTVRQFCGGYNVVVVVLLEAHGSVCGLPSPGFEPAACGCACSGSAFDLGSVLG